MTVAVRTRFPRKMLPHASTRARRLAGAAVAWAILAGFVWWDQDGKPVRAGAEFGDAARALLDASFDHAHAQLELTLINARAVDNDPASPGIDSVSHVADGQTGWASWSASIADLNRGAASLRSAAAEARQKATTLKAALPPHLQSELERDRFDARSFLRGIGNVATDPAAALADGEPNRSP